MNGKSEVAVDTEGWSWECEKDRLANKNAADDDQEEWVTFNSFENIKLNNINSTSSWSFLEFKKLNTCIITKVL